jgi:hypothetical protein
MENKSILGKKQTESYFVYELVGFDLHYVMDTKRKKVMFVCPKSGMITSISQIEYKCNFAHFVFFAQELLTITISFRGDGYFDTRTLTDKVRFDKIVSDINFKTRLN